MRGFFGRAAIRRSFGRRVGMNLAVYGATTVAVAGFDAAYRHRATIRRTLSTGVRTLGRGISRLARSAHLPSARTGNGKVRLIGRPAAPRSGGRGAFSRGHAFFGNQYVTVGRSVAKRSRVRTYGSRAAALRGVSQNRNRFGFSYARYRR